MKKIFKSSVELLRSKAVLAVSGGMILASCGAQVGGYTENDGVYYDPAKDTLPEGVVVNSDNQVGEVYDYNKSAVDKAKINEQQQKDKYKTWSKTSQSSDWGTYLGTDYTYGGYSPYSSGLSFMIMPTIGFGYGYGSMMSFGYSPYGMYGYNPYGYGSMMGYGYSPYGMYSPYYGMYDPYYYDMYAYNPYRYGSYATPRKRSGADGRMSNGVYNSGNPYRNSSATNSPRTSSPRPTYTNPRRFENTQSYPSQQPTYQNNGGFRNDNGGFRNSNSGGFSSPSNSGSSSSSSSNGGFRNSGGFR